MTTTLYAFPDSAAPARRLASLLAIPCVDAAVHRFPDGESLVRIDPPAERAILYRSLDRPNDKLIEILLAAAALRDGGCRHVALVAPYMAYMRQDAAFHRGEAVSQRVVGALIARAVERVVTVNPHLHRTAGIDAVFPGIAATAVDAAPAFADLLAAEGDTGDCVVLGPDAESRPWVEALARRLGARALIAHKERAADRNVTVSLPGDAALTERRVLLLDDVASTGVTLAACAQAARRAGARRIEALVIHALHDEATERLLATAGIDRVISTDSIPHKSNRVALAPLLANAF